MHSNTHYRKPNLGLGWDPANVALNILLVLFFLIFLFLSAQPRIAITTNLKAS